MRFTNKDLANAMGLKIGDRIKLEETILKVTNNYGLEQQENKKSLPLWLLVDTDKDFEIVKPKKKIGDLFCSTIECVDCPLCVINCKGFGDDTLYEQLKKSVAFSDSELYDILKARLDKEVELKWD